MKILHYTKYYPPYFGGIEKVTFDLVEGGQSKNEIEVLCFKKNSHEDVNDSCKNYKIKRSRAIFTILKMPISIKNLLDLAIRMRRNDIVHVHLPNPMAMLYILMNNFYLRKKIVAHWHSDIVSQKNVALLISPLIRFFLKKAHTVIVTSEPYAKHSNILTQFQDKIKLVPIGIDTSDLKFDLNEVTRLKEKHPGKKIIFSLGRLTYYKGFEYLVEAASLVSNDYIFLIGGTGEEQPKLNKIIKEKRLENKVILVGKIPQPLMGAYYEACDIFCLPSIERSEAFGVVQLEAMYFGKPVISTNIAGSGVPWVNKHNESGIVVAPKSAIGIAEAINKICDSNELFSYLSKGAKDRFEKKFTSEKMNLRMQEIYKELYSDN